MSIDSRQLFFDTFGFLVLRGLFDLREVAEIDAEFNEVMAGDRRGTPFSGEHRQGVMGFIERRPRLTALIEDDRIYTTLERLLGPGFVWIGSDGNLYVGNTRWHPDGSDEYQRIKVAFYLDPVSATTGCLRVIPGSHRNPLHERLKAAPPVDDQAESPYGVPGADVPCFPLESDPGDVVMFNQNLWHASYGGRTGRRMFTLNVGAKPTSEAHYDYLRRMHETNRSRFIAEMQVTQTDRVYSDEFLGSDSPRIQGMVAELVELGLR